MTTRLPWVVGAALCVAACSQALGVEQLPRGRFAYAELACWQCTTAHCDAAERQCWHDASCRQLFTCMASCPLNDVDCRTACDEAQPGAFETAAVQQLDSCRRDSCLDPCLGISGMLHVAGDAPECGACYEERCDEIMRSCAAKADLGCGRACTDPRCSLDCVSDRAGGNALAVHPVRECREECALECSFGTTHDDAAKTGDTDIWHTGGDVTDGGYGIITNLKPGLHTVIGTHPQLGDAPHNELDVLVEADTITFVHMPPAEG